VVQGDGQRQQDSPSYGAERPKSEPSADRGGGKAEPASTGTGTGGNAGSDASGDSHPQYVFLGQGPARQNDDGSSSQNTLYQRTADGVYVQTVTTTQKDGTQSEEQHCFKDSNEVDCGGGMTDEPTCRTDCSRVAMLGELYLCTSGGSAWTDCGELPEGTRKAGGPCPTGEAASAGRGSGGGTYCAGDVDKPGGPVDYGDPAGPNGEPPLDASTFVDPHKNDGVTDPVDLGEPELVLGPGESISWDMRGSLRDPAGPPGTENEAPSIVPPNPGDAERNALP